MYYRPLKKGWSSSVTASKPFCSVLSMMCLIVISTGLVSCSGKIEELKKWPFEAKGIRVSYRADQDLNTHHGEAHTLFVCVYQLSEPNAFNELKIDRNGVVKLLECKRFDESVSSSESMVVHPGDEDVLILDRAEDARFCGIVAGYYNLWPEHATKLLLVPVKIEKSGWLRKKRTAVPDRLEVNIYFGPEEIQQVME